MGDVRTAIVTAGDSGIGKATAVALAAGGCEVGRGAEASYTTGASYRIDGGLLLMAAEANRRAE